MSKDTKMAKQNRQEAVNNPYSGYDHYVGVDWSKKTMAIARINGRHPNRVKVGEQVSDLKELQRQLRGLKGRSIVVLEESSPAQWLYVNLVDYATTVVICDPYRNRLLSDGPKTDRIDATKLVKLLYAGMLREIYHSTDATYELRKYVSGYIDLVRQGVRQKNQQHGFMSQLGRQRSEKEQLHKSSTKYVIDRLDAQIALYEQQKREYEELFTQLCKKNRTLRYLRTVPGIGAISAVKILAITVNADRFASSAKYLAYCGLVSHIIESGGRVYGRRRPRFSRVLKEVFKTAAVIVLGGASPMRGYYDKLLRNGVSEHNARNALARYIARVCYGILRDPTKYDAFRFRQRNA